MYFNQFNLWLLALTRTHELVLISGGRQLLRRSYAHQTFVGPDVHPKPNPCTASGRIPAPNPTHASVACRCLFGQPDRASSSQDMEVHLNQPNLCLVVLNRT